MDRVQIEAHLVLQGWEAWVELQLTPLRYNLTHREYGTAWVRYAGEPVLSAGYRYGFERDSLDAKEIGIASIPEHDFYMILAAISGTDHEPHTN